MMSGKFLARAVAIAFALSLGACGGGDGGDGSSLGGPDSGSGGSGGGSTGGSDDSNGETQVSLELGTGTGSNFQSGQMLVSAPELTSGGVTRLEFNVVDSLAGNTIYNSEPVSVTISSLCANATFDSPITSSTGTFSMTYEAGCSGNDTITARLPNGASATANVSVASQEFGALEFVSIDPDTIALSGGPDGGRGTVSDVTFRLADNNGQPIEGEELTFSLSTEVGGISLSQTRAETGPDGQAMTRVNAGTVATVVSVTATYELEGRTIQTSSDPISISSSIPDQDSFSIAVEQNFLPNAMNHDGVEVPIDIRAADRNNNRVSRAVVNFVTNGGSVQSECTLQDGVCSINWISQNPRPNNGRVLILARTVGEESFTDTNSDGRYTDGVDGFSTADDDMGEPFLDINQNGQYDQGEVYSDYNSNNQYDGPNGIYNGTACESGCTSSLLEISETTMLFMTSDSIEADFSTPVSPGEVCITIAGVFSDGNGGVIEGPPPGGTEVSFSTTNGTIVEPSSFSTTTSYREIPVEHCVFIEADDEPDTGTLTVEVTPPAPYSGDTYYFRASISD